MLTAWQGNLHGSNACNSCECCSYSCRQHYTKLGARLYDLFSTKTSCPVLRVIPDQCRGVPCLAVGMQEDFWPKAVLQLPSTKVLSPHCVMLCSHPFVVPNLSCYFAVTSRD